MKKMVWLALILATIVITLGAYTRLTDAGLGCPDWPGCYGQLTVPNHGDIVAGAFPDKPLEPHKAWSEMIHRYFASSLGGCIVIIFILSVWQHRQGIRLLPALLLLLVCFQGALGMWTVTLNLMPVIVMGHLLGGFTLLSGLFWLYLRLTPHRPRVAMSDNHLAWMGILGLVIVLMQIALGGWTSANYAAMACTQLPVCEPGWWYRLDFTEAFSLPHAVNYEFGVHGYSARMTMHIMHRAGAVLTLGYLSWFAWRLYHHHPPFLQRQARTLLLVLALQVLLGLSNVIFSVPLLIAVLHNLVGATLLLTMVRINYILHYQIHWQRA